MDQLEEARSDYIESLAETMRMYGLSPSMGRLFGIMFFHQEPMTLDEMRQRTGMSKTSMSTGVRELSRLKLVQKMDQRRPERFVPGRTRPVPVFYRVFRPPVGNRN